MAMAAALAAPAWTRNGAFPTYVQQLWYPTRLRKKPGKARVLQRTNAVFGFGMGKKKAEIVHAGDPVLYEPAAEVAEADLVSLETQQIIDDLVQAMRKVPAVGLSAPQIGVPLQIIVLEDTAEYISYVSKEEAQAQQREPFELLVIMNPKLETKGEATARFFEGCLSVPDYRGLVERHLEVVVTGLDRLGFPVRVEASGWKARILQHEIDHLSGTLYVDKLIPKTFRTVKNLHLPLPRSCPSQKPAAKLDFNQVVRSFTD